MNFDEHSAELAVHRRVLFDSSLAYIVYVCFLQGCFNEMFSAFTNDRIILLIETIVQVTTYDVCGFVQMLKFRNKTFTFNYM